MRCASLLLIVALTACARAEPPGANVGSASASVAPLPFAAPPSNADPLANAAVAFTVPRAAADADAAGAAPAADDAGAGQTHDKPEASGAAFDGRARLLWEAIARDDAEHALPAFFPVHAYEQVKAVANPASDWKNRLVAAFRRDVHALHQRLGKRAESATFVGADVPAERARWIKPGEEGNRLGYWRVYGTKIRYEVDGRERIVEVTSLISWRGEWFVVHLTGFK